MIRAKIIKSIITKGKAVLIKQEKPNTTTSVY